MSNPSTKRPAGTSAYTPPSLTSAEATLGLSHRVGARADVSLCVVENLPWYGDAADLALRLAVRIR